MTSLQLPKRELGNTGLSVSVLGYGASALGGVFSADFKEDEGIRSVHEAFKRGINFFDTSPFYGVTRSETVLGKALKSLPRSEIVLATKVGRYNEDTFDFSAERVTRSVRESLERLQTDYVDLIQTHDIEFGDLDQVVNETLPALRKLKQEGLVKHIGITGLPLKIYPYVLDRVPPGTVDVALSYCHYTLLDQSLEPLLGYLKDKGVGVINASPLCMGLLTQQGPPDWHPAPEDVKAAARQAAGLCAERGVDIAKLGLMEAVKNPLISSTLVSMPSCKQVDSNVSATLQALGLVQDDNAAAEAEVLAAVQELFSPVLNKTWPSGRPENN